MLAQILAALALAIWLYLLLGRGGFWLSSQRDDAVMPAPAVWPKLTVVIPARDEADGIAACIGSLLRQDYAGEWSIVLVDDGSSDGTATIAREAAAAFARSPTLRGTPERERNLLKVVPGRPLPPG